MLGLFVTPFVCCLLELLSESIGNNICFKRRINVLRDLDVILKS